MLLPDATPPPPYQQHQQPESNTQQAKTQGDSVSDKSQDSGIDSIEKPGNNIFLLPSFILNCKYFNNSIRKKGRCTSPGLRVDSGCSSGSSTQVKEDKKQTSEASSKTANFRRSAIINDEQPQMEMKTKRGSNYFDFGEDDLVDNFPQIWQRREGIKFHTFVINVIIYENVFSDLQQHKSLGDVNGFTDNNFAPYKQQQIQCGD